MMQAAGQMTQAEIRAEAERTVEQEREVPGSEPGPPDEPDAEAGPDKPEAPRAGGRFDSAFVLSCFSKNQVGDAEIFKRLHRGLFLFDHAAGQWFEWAGHYWQQDKTESVVSAMQAVCRVYEIELQRLSWRINKERGKKNG